MNKFINFRKFMQSIFDEKKTAEKAAEIGQAILSARSLRLTDIATRRGYVPWYWLQHIAGGPFRVDLSLIHPKPSPQKQIHAIRTIFGLLKGRKICWESAP